MKVLILCTGNSCRSQIAEGIIKNYLPFIQVFSAGTNPEKQINQYAVQVMKEIGIDISDQYPKNVELFLNDDFDYVFTICDNAKEVCPVFTGKVRKKVHKGFKDPAKFNGTEEEKLNFYRKIRDEIKEFFINFKFE